MTHYLPPYPPRLREAASVWKIIRSSRKSLLSHWTENDFEQPLIETTLFWRQVIIANSPETVRQVLIKHHASFERKSYFMRRALKPLIGDGLFISDGAIWRSRRNLIGSIIHGSRVPDYAPAMIEAVVALRDRWLTPQDFPKRINLLGAMTQLTADIIARTLFGRHLGEENAEKIADGFSNYQKQIGVLNLPALFNLPHFLSYWTQPKLRRSVKQLTRVFDDLIGAAYQNQHQSTSIIQRLQKKLPKKAIRNELIVLFMAGHETVANGLAWAFFLIAQSPSVEKCLHAEIDRVLGGRTPTLDDVPQLVYTRAIIEETLRLYPPIPILTRQAVKDEKIGAIQVKKGAIVSVIPWLLHRHKLYWDKPDHFVPERFLPEAIRPNKYAYIPFSVGPRVCAGVSFGLTEAILSLATLGQAFRFELAPDTEIQVVSHLSLRPDDGTGQLPMLMHVRDTPLFSQTAKPTSQRRCPFHVDEK